MGLLVATTFVVASVVSFADSLVVDPSRVASRRTFLCAGSGDDNISVISGPPLEDISWFLEIVITCPSDTFFDDNNWDKT